MFRQKQHFSALILSHPKADTIEKALANFLRTEIELIESIPTANGNVNIKHFKCITPTVYHKSEENEGHKVKTPKRQKIGDKTFYFYDSYIIELRIAQFEYPLYLFAAPFKRMLRDVIDEKVPKLKSEKASFHYLDLLDLIDKLKMSVENPNIFVTRVNLQATGASGIKSIALYGDDVVLSEQYEDISHFSIPSSIRLFCSKSDSDGFSINTDRGGNWSFYLRDQAELSYFEFMLSYFEKNGLIKKTFTDPRNRRSAQDEKLAID